MHSAPDGNHHIPQPQDISNSQQDAGSSLGLHISRAGVIGALGALRCPIDPAGPAEKECWDS